MSATGIHRLTPSARGSRGPGLELKALAALGLVLALPASAIAKPAPIGQRLELHGSVTWTSVAGRSGSEQVTMTPDPQFFAVRGLAWWESSDEPCKFRLAARSLNNVNVGDSRLSEFCGGSPGNSKSVVLAGQRAFVTAIRVCLTDKRNGSDDKLKGVQLYGRAVDHKTGALGPEYNPVSAAHNHCRDWSEKISCPANQIAATLRIDYTPQSHRSGDAHGYARGIRLGCRAVGPRTSTAMP